jgi:hypothetical protein
MTMLERRKSPRQVRSLEGRIGYAGKYRLRCVILNISSTGAKLALKAPADLPAEFILSISRQDHQREYWARATWRRGKVFGVVFTDPPTGSAPLYGVRGRTTYGVG